MEVCVGYLTEVLGTACLDVGVEPQGTLPDDRTGTYPTHATLSFLAMTEAPRPQVGRTLATTDTVRTNDLARSIIWFGDIQANELGDIERERSCDGITPRKSRPSALPWSKKRRRRRRKINGATPW
ncbi:hypothetical protein CGMCC3_g10769 [Colletotrichum fructicola]|nr:uncharacterized protein CGMCC3_g10769 [Colletotrichum fructicola]KAE9573219.1 hypothetical protein CGMCC3_g10769 [Colletotrichum fructicola]